VAFSESWESVEDVLFIEQRLECEVDGLRVLCASVLLMGCVRWDEP
jgi:hypothetical protein